MVRRLAGRREEQGNGLGQVTDNVVTLFKQPLGDVTAFGCPTAQEGSVHRAFRPAVAEDGHRPEPVLIGGFAKIVRQRRHLGVGFGRLIEGGEEFGKLLHDGQVCSSYNAQKLPTVLHSQQKKPPGRSPERFFYLV